MAFFSPPFSQVLDKKLNVLYCKQIGNKEDQPTRYPSVFATVRMATASDISFFSSFWKEEDVLLRNILNSCVIADNRTWNEPEEKISLIEDTDKNRCIRI